MPRWIPFVAIAFSGALAGVGVRAWLNAGHWRRDGEAQPLPRIWEPVGVAIGWVLTWWRIDDLELGWAWPAVAVATVICVAAASIDLTVHRLPDVLTLGGVPAVAALLVLASALEDRGDAWIQVLWALIVAVPVLFVIALGGMGLGDVKLGLLLALTLGWFATTTALLGLMLGFIIGGVWALMLVLARRANRSTAFAYGPSMMLGALLALVLS